MARIITLIAPRALLLALSLLLLAGCGGPGSTGGEGTQQDIAALTAAFAAAGFTLEERELTDGRTSHKGELDDIRVTLNAQDGALLGADLTMISRDDSKLPGLLSAIKLVAPEWTDAETWIKAQPKARISSTELADGTRVRLEPYPRGGLIVSFDFS